MIRIATIFLLLMLPGFILAISPGQPGMFYPDPDTIPPPPPGGPITLTGPGSACAGDLCEYYTEVPIACTCQWSVNGVVQPETSPAFSITWTQPGFNTLSLVFICNGQPGDPESLTVIVDEMPDPGSIAGDEYVCEYTSHTYQTGTGPNDSCVWKVNGIIQPGSGPAISYNFGDAGNYHFEVTAYNTCGVSTPETLDVTAAGTAPAPPGPIEGVEESCEGDVETYTTTVGPGETCLWRIDGDIKPSTTTTLTVTWTGWGEHQIEVRAMSNCGTGNPAYKDVLVLGQPDVFLGNDTTIIQGQTLLLDAGHPGSDYLWSTGETTQTITVSVAETYSVVVSNFCGDDSDEIIVDVSTGTGDMRTTDDLFKISVQNDRIIFHELPENLIKLQVFTLSGRVIYEGIRVDWIDVPVSGVYLIKWITPGKISYKKLFKL
jgi:hypothetical protein